MLNAIFIILPALCFVLAIYAFKKGHPFWVLGLVILNCGLCIDWALLHLLFGEESTYTYFFSNLMFPLGLLIFFRNLHRPKIARVDALLLGLACLEYFILIIVYLVIWRCGTSCLENSVSFEIVSWTRITTIDSAPDQKIFDSIAIFFFLFQLIIFPFVLVQIWKELKKAKTRHINFFTQDSFEFYTWNFRFIILVGFCYLVVGSILFHAIFFEYIRAYRLVAYIIIGLGGIGFGLLVYLSPTYFKDNKSIANLQEDLQEKANGEKKIESKSLNKYKASLLHLLNEEKLYQDTTLNLQSLATKLNTSTRNLSRIINIEFGQSFADLINGYRIEEVKQNLICPKYDHYAILSIGLEAGFNSKSAFYSTFKKFTKMNPAQYKKETEKQRGDRSGDLRRLD